MLNDSLKATLALFGYTGSVNDAYYQYMLAESGLPVAGHWHINDLEKATLSNFGYTGSLNDMWNAYLTTSGYTGSLNDKMAAFWGDGLGFTPFWAPLTHSLALTRGTGSPTFTRASTATVMGYGPTDNAVDGLKLLTVAANEARFVGARRLSEGVWSNTFADGSLIPAATNLGYLAEVAATNLCLQSQSFDTTWTTTALTTISSTRTAPDGTATAFEFDDGVSGGTSHRIFQSPVNTTAVPHTMSVYAKDVDRGWIGFRLTDSGGVNRLCWFNIAAGVVGTAAAGFTTSIQSLPNGWYRCIATLTTFAGDSTPLLFLAPSDGVDVYVGSNKKAQLWGAQVEPGSFASTYIPTTTAAVTRAADVLTYTGDDIANLKTLCATFRREVGVVGAGESVALSDGTTTNYIVHAAQPNGTDVRFLSEASSVTQWSVITAYTPGTTTKMATSFATNDIKMAKDGVGQTPDTVATVPAFTQLNVGHIAGILQLNGTIRNVRIWQRALSASEMQAITS